MKTCLKIAMFTVFAVLVSNQSAQAGILLEPYLGYVSGKAEQGTSSNYTGMEYGARVGYSMLGFAGGLEYAAATLTDDGTPKSDLTIGDIGVFAAYKFPVLFRVFAAYFPSSEVKVSNSTGSGTYKSGNAMKLGVGFSFLPFVNLNLEYMSSTYSDLQASGVTVPLNPSLTNKSYGLSVSIPFDL